MYEKLESIDFYKLSKYIKENNGEVEEKVLELAYIKAYDMSTIIAISNAKKNSGVYFKKDDVEGFGAEVFVAIKKYFDPKKPPHDLNAFINSVINNKLADLMKERIKNKSMQEKLALKSRDEISYESSTNYTFIDKLIMVKEGIKKLKPLCQQIIQLIAEKYKVSDIIEKTGLDINEDAMRQRMRECRKALGRMIGGHEYE